MFTKPQQQHEWLKKFVGTWDVTTECAMEPGQPSMTARGREVVRMLGDLWVVFEGTGEMPGMPGKMGYLMTLGFDPSKNKFVGSWVGSPMANLFVYEGELDAAGKVLPLNTMGPSMKDPTKLAQYQDVYEIHGPDKRAMWAQSKNDDGTWTKMMSSTQIRVK